MGVIDVASAVSVSVASRAASSSERLVKYHIGNNGEEESKCNERDHQFLASCLLGLAGVLLILISGKLLSKGVDRFKVRFVLLALPCGWLGLGLLLFVSGVFPILFDPY